MSISINNYVFEGPYGSTEMIDNQAGIFIIICSTGTKLHLVDVGESSKIKAGIEMHENEEKWMDYCKGRLFFACHYTPSLQESERTKIVEEICRIYEPPLGQDKYP